MASSEDVSLVVEKIQKGLETGDQCNAMACGKSVPEWTEIFNEAAGALKMPVIPVGPLQGGTRQDSIDYVTNIARAFQQTAGKPALVVVDSTGNQLQKDRDVIFCVGSYIEQLSEKFPKAVYVQIIPELDMGAPLMMYCNKPKKPRDPSQPIYPL